MSTANAAPAQAPGFMPWPSMPTKDYIRCVTPSDNPIIEELARRLEEQDGTDHENEEVDTWAAQYALDELEEKLDSLSEVPDLPPEAKAILVEIGAKLETVRDEINDL